MSDKPFFEKIIDKILSMKKETALLILIFVLGFILRLVAAINLSVKADDMVHVNHAVNFLLAQKLVIYHQSAGLWFAFTDSMYRLFGPTQLTSRAAALIFGSFSVFPLFILTRQFFNMKVALISVFLLAIAPFHIKNTIGEMDVMAMFFVLSAMAFFVIATKRKKHSLFLLSGLFLGIAIYVKTYPLLFAPSFLLYFVYVQRKEKKPIFNKTNVKIIGIFLITATIFAIPALTHNYLLYKDKGFMDLTFSRTLGFGEEKAAQYYAFDAIWGKSNSWKALVVGDAQGYGGNPRPWLLIALNFVFLADPVIFVLGFFGLAFILIRKRRHIDYSIFFLLAIAFALPFLASIILLGKHYIFLELLLIPMAALVIYEGDHVISKKFRKNALPVILIIIALSSLILLALPRSGTTHFYSKSHIAQMIDYKEDSIPDNAIMIFDSRMYRGRINWVGMGGNYLEGTEFINFLNNQESIPGNVVQADIYFFECVIDDCGWGTVKDQPEFNASMEALTNTFKEQGELVSTIKQPDKRKPYFPLFSIGKKIEMVKIYRASIQIKEPIFAIAQQPKSWFLYTLGFQPVEEQFDYYEIHSFFDAMLQKLAFAILYFSLFLAFISPLFVAYYTLRIL